MANVVYEMIGRLFSRRQMKEFGGMLEASGVNMVPEAVAGFLVVLCFIASMLLYLIIVNVASFRNVLFKLSMAVSKDITVSSPEFLGIIAIIFSVILATGIICLAAYVALALAADSRRKKVEDVLPDFLSLSAANVRAGMTVDQAMWYAAKPEFGILSVEVTTVAKRTFGGMPFNKAIDHLSERFNSKAVRRSVALIKQGIASGGKLADILERTAEDSRQMRILRQEIATSLLMYIIFIVFAGAIGTPFLFAISGKLVGVVEGVFTALPTQASGSSVSAGMVGAFVTPSRPAITSADFAIFAILSCILTAVFSSLIIGVISKGSKKDGISYLPFLLILSLAIFFVVSFLLEGFLSNLYI